MPFEPNHYLLRHQYHRLHPLQPMEEFSVGKFKVKAFELKHDVQCFGYIIVKDDNRLVYMTDTAYCKYLLPKPTHLMLGCNYDRDTLHSNMESELVNRSRADRLVHAHSSLQTIMDLLRANDLSELKEIHLLHLSEDNADPEMFRKEIQTIVDVPVYVG